MKKVSQLDKIKYKIFISAKITLKMKKMSYLDKIKKIQKLKPNY